MLCFFRYANYNLPLTVKPVRLAFPLNDANSETTSVSYYLKNDLLRRFRDIYLLAETQCCFRFWSNGFDM